VQRFWECYPAAVSTLEEMENWDDSQARSSSFSLRTCLEKSDTIVGLACLKSISSIMKPLSRALQTSSGDLTYALHLIESTKILLNQMRSEDLDDEGKSSFEKVFEESTEMAERIGIELKTSFGFQINLQVRFKD